MHDSLSSFVQWLQAAPPSTTMTAPDLARILAPLAKASTTAHVADAPLRLEDATWRERVWLVSADTRLGVREVAEALGRTRSFVYRHTSTKCEAAERLPHRKLDGELIFVVGELRRWITDHEEIIEQGNAHV